MFSLNNNYEHFKKKSTFWKCSSPLFLGIVLRNSGRSYDIRVFQALD